MESAASSCLGLLIPYPWLDAWQWPHRRKRSARWAPRQVAVAGSSDPPVELVEHGLPDHQLACDVHVLSLPLRTSRPEQHIGVLAVNDEIQHLWLRLNR